jgi:hypothetical protein
VPSSVPMSCPFWSTSLDETRPDQYVHAATDRTCEAGKRELGGTGLRGRLTDADR